MLQGLDRSYYSLHNEKPLIKASIASMHAFFILISSQNIDKTVNNHQLLSKYDVVESACRGIGTASTSKVTNQRSVSHHLSS